MTAYTGGKMLLAGFYHPVIVDLSGLKVSAKARPILRDHDPSQIVGHTDSVQVNDGSIRVEGTISASNSHADDVVRAADNGFPWQASIGARASKMAYVDKGESVTVNGRKHTGPVYVARQSSLGEVSFVALGADDNTAARMVAAAIQEEGDSMNKFEKWLSARGFVLAELSDEQTATLKAAFDAEQPADDDDAAEDITASADDNNDGADGVALIRAEAKRVAGINAACVDHPEIAAAAIDGDWTVEATQMKVELKELRAARPKAPNQNAGDSGTDRMQVIQAGLLQAAGATDDEVIAETSEKAITAAQKDYRKGIGLQEMLLEAAIANGYDGRRIQAIKSDTQGVIRAAFSTTTLSGILGNTANKAVAKGFDMVEQTWRDIAAIRSVNDFKTVTSYRLTGAHQYQQVGPDGELKHATISETSFTNQADTYGTMFAITRKNIIDDDLDILTQLPRRIGRGAGLKLNDVFWTAFLDNSSFFTSGNGSYFEGAATNLQSSSLQTAVQMFRQQTDEDSKPIGLSPTLLLVPPEIEVDAEELYVSTNNNTGGGSSKNKQPNRNVFAGKYQPLVSSYLSNSSYTGYSATAWYLLADPMDMATIEVAFLNGQQTPTVESADADFNTLGIQMRGYHDFGCTKQEYRAGVKSKGAA